MSVFEAGSKISSFRVVAPIHQGGSGMIYDAVDERDGSRVALKIPDNSYLGDIPSWERFRREVALARRLHHPLIAEIKQASDDPSQPFLAVEYVEGKDLQEFIQDHGALPIDEAIDLAIQICETLEYIHSEQVIHRDLKPANIMIQPDGRPRLVDFGIAKPLDMKRITWKGFSRTFGTPNYMAPEQVQGGRVSAATDIYAMGMMLYEMLAGAPPFESDNAFQVMNWQVNKQPPPLHTRRHDVPDWLEAVVMRAIEKKPQHRYASAAEMKTDLENRTTPIAREEARETEGVPSFIKVALIAVALIGIATILIALVHPHG